MAKNPNAKQPAKAKSAAKKKNAKKEPKVLKIEGKTIINAPEIEFKPLLCLTNKNIPAKLEKTGVGEKVVLTVEGTITDRMIRESKRGKNKEVMLEIDKIK